MCIASTGIAVGTSTVCLYIVDVCYWECPLLAVFFFMLKSTSLFV